MERKESKRTESSSQDLLQCGNGKGIHEKLLLKPKARASLQTEKVPRSSVIDRLQSFLPQMALANEALRQQMEATPVGHFDIESVEDAEKVIEMVVAVCHVFGCVWDQLLLLSQYILELLCISEEQELRTDSTRSLDVALVELEGSDSEEVDSSEDSSSDEESVTEEKLKLPGDRKKKANIQVLEGEGE
ncbi:uncharacterized protein C12orf45 homolog isoform X1 [Hoplias malabaricus]|uniref:uncharacterized protein C12orf45 homolog isoform X1 n=1 Tax=Hoplias malabaricus TaxID=27720 RepID=UPI003462F7DF